VLKEIRPDLFPPTPQGRLLEKECREIFDIFPWRVKDYIEYRYVKRLPYRFMPDWFFGWLERRLGHHLLIVARKMN
jgi:hypothetical protein